MENEQIEEPFNPIIDYHRRIIEKDPEAGKELCRLNAEHLKKAMGITDEHRQVPISVVRKLSKKEKHRNKLKS